VTHSCSLKYILVRAGGIRCEKSAAYVRRAVPSAVSVRHLRGGIHKYLERYGGGSGSTGETETNGATGEGAGDTAAPLWQGRNFVFDGRGAASAEETFLGRDGVGSAEPRSVPPTATTIAVVGRCTDCDKPYDRFDPHCVCTVCREPTLVCTQCREGLVEYHCRQHRHLRNCYFFDLARFSVTDLEKQIQDLHGVLADIAVGKRFKSKRKTTTKQLLKVQEQVAMLRAQHKEAPTSPTGLPPCRNCGALECEGRCWGFYGLKRKQILENQNAARESHAENGAKQARISLPQVRDVASNNSSMKKGRNRQDDIEEILALGLSRPPSEFRDEHTGIRVVPPVTRAVHCRAKGKWCGRLAIQVLKEEFGELARPGVLAELLEAGLLRINGTPIDPSRASQIRVRMQDTLSRIVHWHEPPVQVPKAIPVRKVHLDDSLIQQHGLNAADAVLYVCDKPASVPVHPAGPYLANSLTMMVEAQEGMPPTSLTPLHRTDRATSGLTLCATNPAVCRIFHKCMSVPGTVHKLYLAKVCGRFYRLEDEQEGALPTLPIGTCRWLDNRALQVDAPVETIDPANGVRAVTAKGKPSTSHFQYLSYDMATDTSLVACVPVTGRNHQLRVHLQLLQRPVLGDILYGGRSWEAASVSDDEASLQSSLVSLRDESPPPMVMGSRTCASLPSLSARDVESAKRVCRICRLVERNCGSKQVMASGGDYGVDNDVFAGDDSSQLFSKAQLLQGGHAICLHSLRYRVAAVPRPRGTGEKAGCPTNDDAVLPRPPQWVCDVRVDAPSWAVAVDRWRFVGP
jgi:23S rRNA-/tRNA-specific pseudouridylate synthase